MEHYKEVPFATQYLCSNFGNIKSKRYNKPLKGFLSNCGYVRVQIGSPNNKHYVHRIVAETFIEKIDGKSHVNHIDGNKQNNAVENLEWVTQSENDKHAYDTGLKVSKKGEDAHRSILSLKSVLEIKQLLSNGYNCKYISGLYGVHRKTISDIKNNRTWVM